jgi:hypothetical protein
MVQVTDKKVYAPTGMQNSLMTECIKWGINVSKCSKVKPEILGQVDTQTAEQDHATRGQYEGQP